MRDRFKQQTQSLPPYPEAALGLLTGLGLADRHGCYGLNDRPGAGPAYRPGHGGAGGLSVLSKRLPLTAYLFPKSESENGNRKPFSEHGNQLQKSISETEYRNRFQNTETETPPAIFKNMSAK